MYKGGLLEMKKDGITYNAEREHGKWLSQGDPLQLWGWASPAGRLRAERRAMLIASGAHLNTGSRVLEIGCGTGLFTEKFAKYGCRILAVDLSPELLSLAKRRKISSDQVNFLEAPFEECLVHGPFDAVIGSSILHHLDCSKALPKIFDLLKHGGLLSFCEPNMLNPQIWITLKFRRFFPWMSPDETAFTSRCMRLMLTFAGFSNIDIVPFDWLHPRTPEYMIPVVKFCERIIEGIPGIRQFAGSLWCTAQRP
jgi:2-polyprenyl-3-methyl-5-hydroxy-6-metoxy-1,4-benzoquinol methylase